MTISIILIDDNLLFRSTVEEYLRTVSDVKIVGQAGDGVEGLSLANAVKPDVVVMDWVMPKMGGLNAARLMIGQLAGVRIVVLSMHDDEIHVRNAVQIGAYGYVLKEDTVEHLVQAIRAAAKGKQYFSPRIRSMLGNH